MIISAASPKPHQPPSPFVARWLPVLRTQLDTRLDTLDLAMGGGRHTRLAAELGFRVFGVDRDLPRVRSARTGALRRAGLWVADLEATPLPTQRFDLIICTNYLQRTIWDTVRDAIRPGGFVIYETFTVAQREHGTGPRSPAFLLRPGELREVFDDWDVWHDEEPREPASVAQVVARKPE